MPLCVVRARPAFSRRPNVERKYEVEKVNRRMNGGENEEIGKWGEGPKK